MIVRDSRQQARPRRAGRRGIQGACGRFGFVAKLPQCGGKSHKKPRINFPLIARPVEWPVTRGWKTLSRPSGHVGVSNFFQGGYPETNSGEGETKVNIKGVRSCVWAGTKSFNIFINITSLDRYID